MFRQAVKGITVKTDNVNNVTIVINPDDMKLILQEVPINENGCFTLVAEKRPEPSPKGHTHYKPCYVTAPVPKLMKQQNRPVDAKGKEGT